MVSLRLNCVATNECASTVHKILISQNPDSKDSDWVGKKRESRRKSLPSFIPSANFTLGPILQGCLTFQANGCHVSWGDAQETHSAFLCQISVPIMDGAAATPYIRAVRQTPNPVSVYTLSKLCGWVNTYVEGARISAAVLHRSLDMCFRERGKWALGEVSDCWSSWNHLRPVFWLCLRCPWGLSQTVYEMIVRNGLNKKAIVGQHPWTPLSIILLEHLFLIKLYFFPSRPIM